MLALALACGGLAASEVSGRVREVEEAVGSPVPVLVAARDVAPGADLRPADVAMRDVPSRFAPPDALRAAGEAVGTPVAAGLVKDSYITVSTLGATEGAGGGGPGPLRRGERALEVAVAGGESLAGVAGPGSRVDVLVSTDPGEGPGRTQLALERVELLDLTAGGGAEAGFAPGEGTADQGASASASSVATLRVTVRQAVYLTAAQNYAREVRLLPRPVGDRGRARRAAVAAGDL
jgi:pilus assembly protein CpaB